MSVDEILMSIENLDNEERLNSREKRIITTVNPTKIIYLFERIVFKEFIALEILLNGNKIL